MQDENDTVVAALRRGDLEQAGLPENEHALLQFVATVTRHAYRVTDAEVARLRALGWSDEQIGECVYITALFAFFNRVADAFGLEDPGYIEALERGQREGLPSASQRAPEAAGGAEGEEAAER